MRHFTLHTFLQFEVIDNKTIHILICRELFANPETGELKKSGDIVKYPKLAETYRRIAEGGPEAFYNGTLRDDIMADLNEDGKFILV